MSSITDFEFITGTILDQKAGSPLLMAFSYDGILSVGDIVLLSDRSIDRLKYKDPSFTPPIDEPLGQGYQNLIRCFNAFVETKIADGDPIHGDWQNKATKAEFNEYRFAGYGLYVQQRLASTPTTTTNTNTNTKPTGLSSSQSSSYTPKARDPVQEFKKGIKRDPASFAILKDNKQWDSIRRTLTAQVEYQDVADIINPIYKPTLQEDIELFAEKQKYMYSVFEKILQTDESKSIVRSHDHDRDAQKIYIELLQVMTLSTEALMASNNLLSYLTNAKISDGTWRGSSKSFVLSWVEKLRLYHETVLPTDHLSDNVQRTMLQNAVLGLDALRQVQVQTDLQQATTSGIVLTFTQYRSLLVNAATGHDSKGEKNTSNGRSRRAAFRSETVFDDQYGWDDDAEDIYDLDTTPAELIAYATNRRERPQFPPGSRMPIARWKALSEDAKKIWDTMEDADKAKILANQEPRKTALKSDSSKYSVNAHVTEDAPEDLMGDGVLLAMVTKQSHRALPNSHPADVRSVLAQATKKAPSTVQVQDDTVSFNGHSYVRVAKVHDIRYDVSQASRRKQGSLIDRGANGGIAGSDTRVIARHPHRTVDIRGIDNHEITSIPVVSAGAVARSQRGAVIVVFHQYAYPPQQGGSIHSSCQLKLFPTMSMTSQFIHQAGFNVLRLRMVMFSLSVYEMGYRTLPCVPTRMRNTIRFHM
jgi:hypothetical protein